MVDGEVKSSDERKKIIEKAALLMQSPRTEFIELENGKGVTVKAITPARLGIIYKGAKDDDFEMLFRFVYEGLEEPKLTLPEIRSMKFPYLIKLSDRIAFLSGIPTRRGRPILTPETLSTSIESASTEERSSFFRASEK